MNTNGCQAITIGEITPLMTFDSQHADGTRNARHCRKNGQYSVADKVSCAGHLPLLIDEAAGEWDGSLVPVQRLHSK